MECKSALSSSSSSSSSSVISLDLETCLSHCWSDGWLRNQILCWEKAKLESGCENSSIRYWVSKSDVAEEYEFVQSLIHEYRYPVGFSFGVVEKCPRSHLQPKFGKNEMEVKEKESFSADSDDIVNHCVRRKIDWDAVDWVIQRECGITNYSKKEERVRDEKNFLYKFRDGHRDKDVIDENTFYNLIAMRAKFSDEFCKEGVHGYRDKIFVSGIVAQKISSIPSAWKELMELVATTGSTHPEKIIAIIYRLPESCPFSIQQFFSARNSVELPFFHRRSVPTIIECDQNCMYLCTENSYRRRLDLHGMSVKEAKEKVKAFIFSRAKLFFDSCFIIPGLGNHSDNNPSLLPQIKKFLKTELKSYVKNVIPTERSHGGELLVLLKKFPRVRLTGHIRQDVVNTIRVIDAESKTLRKPHRLQFSYENIHSPEQHRTLQKLHAYSFEIALGIARLEDRSLCHWSFEQNPIHASSIMSWQVDWEQEESKSTLSMNEYFVCRSNPDSSSDSDSSD